jgi:LPXTG-motif cell wall-anchored protein
MSTGTKAALGAAIALGVILVGTGVYLFLKRRKNTTKPPVAVFTEPSTDPEKYDGQSNRFFFSRKVSTEEQVTAAVTDGHELDGRSTNEPAVPHMMPHEMGGNPVYHSQGNPLHESGGQGRYETSGNPRYEIHGHPRDNYEAIGYNYEVT